MVPKFRAWDKNNNEMIFWRYLLNGYNLRNVFMRPEMCGLVLMQSTGLVNCETENGEKIEGWQGDVADIGWSDQTGEFHSDRIVLKSPFDYSVDEARWLIHAEYIIIRGNIYENPELLEEKV